MTRKELYAELGRCVRRSQHAVETWGETHGNTHWLIEQTGPDSYAVRAAGRTVEHCLGYMAPGRFVVSSDELVA